MIDFMTLLIGCCLLFVGAFFFGYPIGLRHGSRMVADQVCQNLDAKEPYIVRDARRRLDRRDVLNAEVIE